MKSLLLLVMLGLCSCVQLQYSAQTPKGTETFAYNSFGGSGALDSAGGTRLTHNHNKTAGQFFQTVATVAGSVAASAVQRSDNALSATKVKSNSTPTVTTPVESPSGAILEPKVTFPPQQ